MGRGDGWGTQSSWAGQGRPRPAALIHARRGFKTTRAHGVHFKTSGLSGDTRPPEDRLARCAPVGTSAGDDHPAGSLAFLSWAREGSAATWNCQGRRSVVNLEISRGRQARAKALPIKRIRGGCNRAPDDPSIIVCQGVCSSGAAIRREPWASALKGVPAAHTCPAEGAPAATNQISTGSPGALQACYKCRAAGPRSQLPANLGGFDQDFVKFHRDIQVPRARRPN